MTALDPDDPEVAAEVAQRLANGDFHVAEGDVADDNPLRLKPRRNLSEKRLWTVLVLLLLAAMAFMGTTEAEPWWWFLCVALMFCGTLVVAHRHKVFSPASSKRQKTEELARQVRLSQMARRNACRYRSVLMPGDSLFPKGNSPLRLESILSSLVTNGLCEVGDDFCSGMASRRSVDDASWFPAEWGNLTLHNPPVKNQRHDNEPSPAFRGWYLMVALPRAVPHIVLDAKADNVFGMDRVVHLDAAQRVPMDARFDSRFTVYAPEDYDEDARDLIPDSVRRRLTTVADGVDVELVDKAVVFFSPGPLRWDEPAGWARLNQLRGLVQEVMYPRIGEYVDAHQRKPRKKKGKPYSLLTAKPPAPLISSQGKVLKPSRNVNWASAAAALLIVALFFAAPSILRPLAAASQPIALLVMLGIPWIISVLVVISPQFHRRPKRDRTLR